jgi:MinD superfamily P-loop ATPase
MHNCTFCKENCDCHYVGNEEHKGDDFLCTGCSDCEEEYRNNAPKEANDFGSTDYMTNDTVSYSQSQKL